MNDRKKRILIIEDEQDFLEALAARLKDAEYEVITAIDGFIGLEKARNEHPDLIILDLMLPKINGYKVSRLLKFDESYKHIPILMLTARVEEADKKLGMETGADAYFTKPCDHEELMSNIERLIESNDLV